MPTPKSKKKKTTTKRRKGGRLARRADRYDLYQRSVQEPEADVRFFNRIFRRETGRPPRILREDFCGTGYLSCTWVQHHRENEAWGYDLDRVPLAWGLQHNVEPLTADRQRRVRLLEGNALEVRKPQADIVAALNFSYFTFKTRDQLREYFAAAHGNLRKDGMLILDIEGGPEAQDEREETRRIDGFTYVWDQDHFDAITNNLLCHIHFRFRDGSAMRRAFSYDWRLWSLPEVRELLAEAGFRRSDVYWEGTERDTGEGNGVFRLQEHADNSESWIAYVVGVK